MSEMTKWVALLVGLLGATAGAIADSNSNSPPLGKASDVQAEDVINILKTYPVNKIESGMVDSTKFVYTKLPPVPFEKWLASITHNAPLEWKEDGCAAYDSDIDENDEHCASFSVNVRTPKLHCPEVDLSFAVETDGSVYFLNDNSVVNDFGAKGYLQQIADLGKTLAEVNAKTAPDRPATLPAPSIKAMSDSDMIQYVQALDVHSLDPTLPPERFDRWLEAATRWRMDWRQASAIEDYHSRCEPKRLVIRVYAAYGYDPENSRPPVDILIDIGSWERGIEGVPKLSIYFKGTDDPDALTSTVTNLSTLKMKINDWNTKLLSRKPVKPTPPKAPVVQNMSKFGFFSRIQSTHGWHCYGYKLGLWKHGEKIFGTFYELDGQCADSTAPTNIVRDVNFDPKTGKLEFWTYGKPGYKFVGKMDQNTVIGEFPGMPYTEEVKLKRSEEHDAAIPDSDKNIEVWCNDYAPKVRNIVETELKELCKALGVH